MTVAVLRYIMIALAIASFTPLARGQEPPRVPFPRHLTYAPGTIRPDHRTQAAQDDDVRGYYDHWKASYLVAAGTAPDGTALYRVSFGKSDPGRTVSEGQGYGMIIAVTRPRSRPGTS